MGKIGPNVSIGARQDISADVMPPMVAVFSGEVTASKIGQPLGAARFAGQVEDVWLSCEYSGKATTTAALNFSGEVYINGVSCLTTKPIIAYVSGEATQHKTTKITGDTGIIQSVINGDANTFSPGDILTCDISIQRSNADSEITNIVLEVEFSPKYL